jgi:hypothetical protein
MTAGPQDYRPRHAARPSSGAATPATAGPGGAPVHARLPGRARAALDALTPVHIGVLAGLAMLLFVLGRLVVAADGDVTRFVVAGNVWVDAATVDPPIHVFDSDGYDGQFYWRLAVDPYARDEPAVHGVTLDNVTRATRVTYPALAYVASLAQPGLAAWSLVAVNVATYGVLAGMAAAFARDRGHGAVAGLLVAASSGLVMAVARDLCEVVMVAAVVAGVVAVGRRRYGWAALAWSVAVLTHEQAVYVVAAYGLYRLAVEVRRDRRWGAGDLPWVVPGLAFVACQGLMAAVTGEVAILGSGGNNATLPFAELLPELAGWLTGDLSKQEALVLPELALLVAVVGVAARRWRLVDAADRWLLCALAVGALFAASLSREVWVGPAELRQVVLVPTLAWLVVLAARQAPPVLLTAATGVVWVAVVGLRMAAI